MTHQRTTQYRTLHVRGDDDAKASNPLRAYDRDQPLIEITEPCIHCGQTFTALMLPGTWQPRYCSEQCRTEHAKQLNRERVRRSREKRKAAR